MSRGLSRALAVVARRSFVYPIAVSFVSCSLSRRGCLWGMCPAHFCHHPLFFFFLWLADSLRYHVRATQFSFYSTGQKVCTVVFRTCCCRANFCSFVRAAVTNGNLVSALSNVCSMCHLLLLLLPLGQITYRPLFSRCSPSALDIDHQLSWGSNRFFFFSTCRWLAGRLTSTYRLWLRQQCNLSVFSFFFKFSTKQGSLFCVTFFALSPLPLFFFSSFIL